MFEAFRLKGLVGGDMSTDLDDTLATKQALHTLGHFRTPSYGLTAYPDRPMIDGLKSFQRANGLKVDGIMRPDGPTHRTLAATLKQRPDTARPQPAVSDVGGRERPEAPPPAPPLPETPASPGSRATSRRLPPRPPRKPAAGKQLPEVPDRVWHDNRRLAEHLRTTDDDGLVPDLIADVLTTGGASGFANARDLIHQVAEGDPARAVSLVRKTAAKLAPEKRPLAEAIGSGRDPDPRLLAGQMAAGDGDGERVAAEKPPSEAPATPPPQQDQQEPEIPPIPAPPERPDDDGEDDDSHPTMMLPYEHDNRAAAQELLAAMREGKPFSRRVRAPGDGKDVAISGYRLEPHVAKMLEEAATVPEAGIDDFLKKIIGESEEDEKGATVQTDDESKALTPAQREAVHQFLNARRSGAFEKMSEDERATLTGEVLGKLDRRRKEGSERSERWLKGLLEARSVVQHIRDLLRKPGELLLDKLRERFGDEIEQNQQHREAD